MPRTVLQERFAPVAAVRYQINVHQHPVGRRRVLVFVHGLAGSAYKTWGNFLRFCFDDEDTATDVAVFGYPTLLKRAVGRQVPIDRTVVHLEQEIASLAQEYKEVFLVGHSLGGLLVEWAAMRAVQSSGANG